MVQQGQDTQDTLFPLPEMTKPETNLAPSATSSETKAASAKPSSSSKPTAANAASKAADAFRTISEVADEIGVQAHVLRFWETKFDQIKPVKRRGGRRYYRPSDIELLKRVKSLLYEEGYTINGVKKLFRQGQVRQISQGMKKTVAKVEMTPVARLEQKEAAKDSKAVAASSSTTSASLAAAVNAAPAKMPADQRKVLEIVLEDMKALKSLLSKAGGTPKN